MFASTSKQLLLLAAFASTAFVATAIKAREWVDITGQYRTEADFVALEKGVVRLRKENGELVRIPLTQLSLADQSFAQSIAPDLTDRDSRLEIELQSFFTKHCVACHDAKKAEGELNLTLSEPGHSMLPLSVLAKSLERIAGGEMPPKSSPVFVADRERMIQAIRLRLKDSLGLRRDPGAAIVRRLSAVEYNNSFFDVVGADFDVAGIVGITDESHGNGFANQLSAETLSPAVMEKYFAAADLILDAVFEPPEPQASPEELAEPSTERSDSLIADPPLGRRASDETNVESSIAVQVRWAGQDAKENQLRPHFQIVNEGDKPVQLSDLKIRYWFTSDDTSAKFQHWCDYAKIQSENVTRKVVRLKSPTPRADSFLEIGFADKTLAPRTNTGEIQIRVALADWKAFDQSNDYSFDADRKSFVDAPNVTLYQNDQIVWGVEPGEPTKKPERTRDSQPPATSSGGLPSLALSELRKAIAKTESESNENRRQTAGDLFEAFASRAWRRPIHSDEIEVLLSLYDKVAAKEGEVSAGVRAGLKMALVSPYFLLRVERNEIATRTKPWRQVDDHELAVRLSYFLWSRPPDRELRELADRGILSNDDVLMKQMRRMLADDRARALTENFGVRWLRLNRLESALPTVERYPEFTPSLKKAMLEEASLFFDHLRTDDRDLLEIVDADFTFVNGELAHHYRLPGVSGARFRKIELRAEQHRGGVISMGGVLALTSHTYRTSPTLRGKYVLEVLLGSPPPPPPANTGSLSDEAKRADPKNFRELLSQHASDAACAACHRRIDPIGFGLENYDAIGRWRDDDRTIEAVGELPSGESFSGPAELKQLLLSRREQFLRNVGEQTLIYALGRPLEESDAPSVYRVKEALKKDSRFSTLVEAVVTSFPFQHRRNIIGDTK